MTEFDRKIDEASARVNRHVASVAERLEKETAEFVNYLNDEVVPAVRSHSTQALRRAAEKLSHLADYLDHTKAEQIRNEQTKR
jgi:F0F1-type ATP synthase membrane subunit b/b'